MSFIVGRKLKMDQVWQGEKVVPVTLIEAGPVVITQIKTTEKDGYQAIQVGFDNSAKKLNKSIAGHLKNLGNFRVLKEFKVSDVSNYKVGDTIDVSVFNPGDKLRITGNEKGRGYQGVVKRHGFHGGPKTHGQKNRFRAPGSIGATAPQRVLKGRKMAGRMGGDTVTLRKVKVVEINKEKNILTIKGQIPGATRGLVVIEKM